MISGVIMLPLLILGLAMFFLNIIAKYVFHGTYSKDESYRDKIDFNLYIGKVCLGLYIVIVVVGLLIGI